MMGKKNLLEIFYIFYIISVLLMHLLHLFTQQIITVTVDCSYIPFSERRKERIMEKKVEKPKKLLVIGAGFGRTGTMSLKKALEILLSYPCYHMIEVQTASISLFHSFFSI